MEKTVVKTKIQDLIIIGGGIMGLFTAYYASQFTKKIIMLEKLTIGNKKASSFSITRSFRTDYLDPYYSRLAYESQLLWKDLQKKSEEQFLIKCGFLNIAKSAITPDLSETYAEKSYRVIKALNFQPQKLLKSDLKKRFPQVNADLGCLDTKAGFLYLPAITTLLLTLLKQRNITIYENITIRKIEEKNETISISTDNETLYSKKLVLTSGVWTNELLKCIKKNNLTFPITLDRPQECKYIYPPKKEITRFLPENFPGIAYLDVGIYLHPIFDKEKGAIKIGYYNPPDLEKKTNAKIKSIADFINECLPMLRNARTENVMDADQCSYDLVKDDNFIVGKLPKFKNIAIGTGWRGTGYKFAPLMGKILMQFALQKDTIYNVSRFSPERFIKK